MTRSALSRILQDKFSARPYRYSLSRQGMRVAILACITLVFGIWCYKSWWSSSLNPYSLDNRPKEFVESACTGQVITSNNSPQPHLKPQLSNGESIGTQAPTPDSLPQILLEHEYINFLLPPITPDQTIPLSILDKLPVRGVLYMVVRNEQLQEIRLSMRSVEDRFNYKFNYPWVILSTQHFPLDVRGYITKITSAPVYFGKIDLEAWNYPPWISIYGSELVMAKMERENVYRGGSLYYHQYLRYQAGLWFYHPLFRQVEYGWRIEPGSEYSCDINEDLFQTMRDKNKKLGFTLTMKEAPNTIPNLWKAIGYFSHFYQNLVVPFNQSIMPWLVYPTTGEYNFCHIWNTFEIVDLSFLRSNEYKMFFEYMDRTGGFFYERWGDAAFRTMAAALFLKREELHFFNKVGYSNLVAERCPFNQDGLTYFNEDSCTAGLLHLIDKPAIGEMADFARDRMKVEGFIG
ncbi:glycosyltransferase family 15 protein [Phycomyces blakesleeanus]